MAGPIKEAAKRAYGWLRSRVRSRLTLRKKNARWKAGPLLSIILRLDDDGEDRTWFFDSLRKQSFRDFEIVQVDDKDQTVGVLHDAHQKMAAGTTDGQTAGREPANRQEKGLRRRIRGRYICTVQDLSLLKATFFEKALFLLESYNLETIRGAEVGLFGKRPPVIARCARLTSSRRRRWRDRMHLISGHIPESISNSRVLSGALQNGRQYSPRALSISETIISAFGEITRFRVQDPLINLVSRSGRWGRNILLAIPQAIIGGADSVLLHVCRHLKGSSFAIYIVATMAVPQEWGDSSGQYESVIEAFYNLPEFLESKEEYGDFIEHLVVTKGIGTVFQVGSEVVYELLPSLKRRHPNLRVIDQLFNEVGHLANNRRFAEHIDHTIVTNATIKRMLVEEYSEEEGKVKVIIHGVDTRGDFDPVRYSGDATVRSAQNRDGFTVSYCGRISEEKGPDVFLDIARELLDIPGIRFVMTGNGPMLSQISTRASELGLSGKLTMPGFLKDVRACLIETDVVVVPSRIEGIPIIMLEAMSFGIPVVAAAVGGIPSIITDGFNGFLCEREDVEAFAMKIRRLHSDQGLRESIASNSRAFALEKLDMGRMVDEYASVFLSVEDNRICN